MRLATPLIVCSEIVTTDFTDEEVNRCDTRPTLINLLEEKYIDFQRKLVNNHIKHPKQTRISNEISLELSIA